MGKATGGTRRMRAEGSRSKDGAEMRERAVVADVVGRRRGKLADVTREKRASDLGQRTSVVPRHPRRGVVGDALVMTLKRDEVAKRRRPWRTRQYG